LSILWPIEWGEGPHSQDDPTTLCEIDQESPEYNIVLEKFLNPKRTFKKKITQIQRVQNPKAWAAYYSKVKQLAARNVECDHPDVFLRANERWMKHGSGGADPAIISEHEYGLDCRYSGDRCYYGRAAYTAEDVEYSDSYRYNIPGTNLSQIFLVRVAAGRIKEVEQRTAEHKEWKHPPSGYNSVRGDVRNGENMAIMVYQPEQAYPCYLITYEQ